MIDLSRKTPEELVKLIENAEEIVEQANKLLKNKFGTDKPNKADQILGRCKMNKGGWLLIHTPDGPANFNNISAGKLMFCLNHGTTIGAFVKEHYGDFGFKTGD